VDELKAAGLLDSRLPDGLDVPMPSDDPALRDDEDELDPDDLDFLTPLDVADTDSAEAEAGDKAR
jgi:segregation and condensation protein B